MKDFTLLKVSQIKVDRKSRQRTELKHIESLAQSILEVGLINPITVRKDTLELIAGERRLEACRMLNPEWEIKVHFFEDLSPEQLQILEAVENIKRDKLFWKDEARMVSRLYNMLGKNAAETGRRLTISEGKVRYMNKIWEELEKGNPQVHAAIGIRQAANVLKREAKRTEVSTMGKLLDNLEEIDGKEPSEVLGSAQATLHTENMDPVLPAEAPFRIQQGDFNTFCREYRGQKFDFLHCDFPYGINYTDEKANFKTTTSQDGYDDSPEVYWKLLDTLVDNWTNILYPVAHVIFWLSPRFYSQTRDYLKDTWPDLTLWHVPLIWFKTDGLGSPADFQRFPRNCCEFALFGTIGDRRLVKQVTNCVGVPTCRADALHVNEKPLSVLSHFFQLTVDSTTRILDPTCGAGSAIQMAGGMGAEGGLGIELSEKYVAIAQRELVPSIESFRLAKELESQE